MEDNIIERPSDNEFNILNHDEKKISENLKNIQKKNFIKYILF